MSFNDEINIGIFRQIQDKINQLEKIDLLEKIFFRINDGSLSGIKSKEITIIFGSKNHIKLY